MNTIQPSALKLNREKKKKYYFNHIGQMITVTCTCLKLYVRFLHMRYNKVKIRPKSASPVRWVQLLKLSF